MSLSHSPSVVREGLVLHLDAANPKSYPGSGTTWFDLSGKGNNGTLANTPTFTSNNKGGIIFDGVDDYCTFTTFNSLNSLLGSNSASEITASFVIEMLNSQFFEIFSIGASFRIVRSSSSSPNPRVINGITFYKEGSWRNAGQANYIIEENKKYSVSISYKNRLVEVYVNGNFISSSLFSVDWPSDSTHVTNIARYIETSPSLGNGVIYNFAIYNKALSSNEIQQNFEAYRDRYGI